MKHLDLLNAIRLLKTVDPPGDEWLSAARAALTAKMAASPLSGAAASGLWVFGRPRAAGILLAALLILITASTSMVLAAQNELPGGRLYGVKLFLEEVQTLRAPTPTAKAKVVLQHARTRLAEARQLAENKSDPATLKVALEIYQTNLNAVNNQLLDLQQQGKIEEAQGVAAAVSESSLDHKDALKVLVASTEAASAAAPALVSAEKAAEASDQLAGTVLIQINLAAGGAKPITPPAAEAQPDPQLRHEASEAAQGAPVLEPAPTPTAEVKPPAPPPKEEIVTPSTPAERAYRLAIAKYGDAAFRYRQFLNILEEVSVALEPGALADLENAAAAAGEALNGADKALTNDQLVDVYSFSSQALLLLIDAETALKAALPKIQPAPADSTSPEIEPSPAPPVTANDAPPTAPDQSP